VGVGIRVAWHPQGFVKPHLDIFFRMCLRSNVGVVVVFGLGGL
jgi:hypothetical protein